jgi:phenylacetate-CoA ligase
VVDTYSSQECGYIAMQCPNSGLYHIQSESVLVEVLDSHDQPCQPGEIGRLVVTPLHNFVAPLIRYEIGDYAEAGETCPCGRGLPTLRCIMGRERNMLQLPNGETRWPLTGYQEFSKVAPIQQFQMVQKSLEKIEARFVVERALSSVEESSVLEIVRHALGYPFDIHVVYMTVLPRSASGKFEEFISEIQPGKKP